MESYAVKRRVNKKKKAKWGKTALIVRTLIILSVCGIAAFLGLVFRLFDLQVVNSSYFESRALQSQLRHTTLTASRGAIFDANGNILAMSAPSTNVFLSPLEILTHEQDTQLIANGLSEILDVSEQMILERMQRTSSQYERIKIFASNEQVNAVRDFISEHSLRGIHFEATSKRHYPNDRLASQIIGFVGTEHTGLDGLEQRFDRILSGVDGRTVNLRSGRGTDMVLAGVEDYFSAQDGFDLTLTIDLSIQYYLERHLAQAIVDYDIQNGAVVIAMSPKTGAILGMASYPNFNPNDFLSIDEAKMYEIAQIEDDAQRAEALNAAQLLQWRNRALTDTYEPGSVFKIITLAMALEENVTSLDSHYYCRGYMHIVGRQEDGEPIPLRCWNRWGHGNLGLAESFHMSCNIASVTQGLNVGAGTFYEYICAFGLFDRTGLDNSAEARGIWWDERVFFNRDNQSQLAAASFGQTFRITPIQMISSAAATINGGYLMQPHVVSQIADSSGNVIESFEPTVLRQVVSAETSATMRMILEGVVESGTGVNAQVRGFRVGGKTGTSENVEQIAIAGEDAAKDYIVSFIGFAPADDPEVIILLLLDTPSNQTGIYISGGSMAAPVVGNMLADILPLSLGIRPYYTEEELQDINIIIPSFSNRDVSVARAGLEAQGFDYSIVGSGETVVAQLPRTNANVAFGTPITLFTENDPPRDRVTVPALSGLSYEGAKEVLRNSGMFIRTTGVSRSNARATVSVQSMPPGYLAIYGSVIEVTLIDSAAIELRN